MKYSRKSKSRSFEQGGEVKDQGKITKQSVYKMTQERLNKEFPNNKIPEEDVRDISLVWLLSGLSPRIMNEQIQKIKDKAKPKVAPAAPSIRGGGEADSDDAVITDGQ